VKISCTVKERAENARYGGCIPNVYSYIWCTWQYIPCRYSNNISIDRISYLYYNEKSNTTKYIIIYYIHRITLTAVFGYGSIIESLRRAHGSRNIYHRVTRSITSWAANICRSIRRSLHGEDGSYLYTVCVCTYIPNIKCVEKQLW